MFSTHKLNIRSHGKQHGGCKARRMNPASGQRRAFPDARSTNPTDQRPESNDSVRKLLQLIFKGGVY